MHFFIKTRVFLIKKGATFLAKCIQSCVCKLAGKHSNIAAYLFDLEYKVASPLILSFVDPQLKSFIK